MAAHPSITAFFPAYNDAGTIGSMVVSTIETLEAITDDYEVIVCREWQHRLHR